MPADYNPALVPPLRGSSEDTSKTPMTLGVLGGTFDPIHCGHVAAAPARAAGALRSTASCSCRRASRRIAPTQPQASGADRLAMAEIGRADRTSWSVSDIELKRDGPSYTFDTLTELRAQGLTPVQIFFITGADAFAEIATWSRYPAVLDLAHFVVVARPGITLDSIGKRLPDLAGRMTTPGRVHATQPKERASF